jgi:L-alanine-DL-glutamate epimerase-like enolase superfamily enzyme
MASMRNSNYYEMGLVHPKVPSHAAQVYLDGYSDRLDSIDENGCVHPPEKPGLGVELDWEFIEKNTVDKVVLD